MIKDYSQTSNRGMASTSLLIVSNYSLLAQPQSISLQISKENMHCKKLYLKKKPNKHCKSKAFIKWDGGIML